MVRRLHKGIGLAGQEYKVLLSILLNISHCQHSHSYLMHLNFYFCLASLFILPLTFSFWSNILWWLRSIELDCPLLNKVRKDFFPGHVKWLVILEWEEAVVSERDFINCIVGKPYLYLYSTAFDIKNIKIWKSVRVLFKYNVTWAHQNLQGSLHSLKRPVQCASCFHITNHTKHNKI